MDESAEVRDATWEVLRDVEPPEMSDRLRDRVDGAWLVPGVLTVRAARRVGVDGLPHGLRRRAAGVQVVYEGLDLTRNLVHESPWTAGTPAEGDMGVLAADILVARGAYLLARTEAVDKGVEIIQEFGRDQTERARGDPGYALEADIFELAAVAGSTMAEPEPPADVLAWTGQLAEGLREGEFPDLGTLAARTDPGAGNPPAVAGEGRPSSSDP